MSSRCEDAEEKDGRKLFANGNRGGGGDGGNRRDGQGLGGASGGGEADDRGGASGGAELQPSQRRMKRRRSESEIPGARGDGEVREGEIRNFRRDRFRPPSVG